MKLLCLAILVLLGHEALTNPRRVKHQRSSLNHKPAENTKVNLGTLMTGCKEGQFQCDTDLCLSKKKSCDGRVNCKDGTDEDDCLNLGMTTGNPEATTGHLESTTGEPWVIEPRHTYLLMTDCKEGEFQCDTDLCLSKEKSCDGRVNCKDGTDEDDCYQVEKVVDTVKRAKPQECVDTVFSHTSGTIIHPIHGGNYQDDEDCVWIINAGTPIKITFTSFQVETNYDFLEIRDGDRSYYSSLGRFTGHTLPEPVETSGNAAYLQFTSDYSNRYGGFVLRWAPGCGGVFSNTSGTIVHPIGGGNYQDYEDCVWRINAGTPIKITFTSFQVEYNYDFLEIRDGNSSGSSSLVRFTGRTTLPHPVETSGNASYLQFTSDYSNHFAGFVLHWAPSGCGGVFSNTSGTIVHPIGGGNYQDYEDCVWRINAGTPIKITFTSFRVENNYDFLEIRDGNSSGSSLLGKFTGLYTLPDPFETSGKASYLQFTSDYSIHHAGFVLHWAPLGCGEVYTTSNGVVKHPLSGGNYENNENCVWKINAAEPIEITFVSLDLEEDHDFLHVRDGPSSDSPLLGSYTGSITPKSILTTGKNAHLHFSSDYSNPDPRPGFVIRWKPTYACGQVNRGSRIVNGVETEVNEYPWQAAMVYSGTSSVFCGASVIGSKHVLTAAHCTQQVTDDGHNYQVLVGAHQLSSPAASQIRLEAARFFQHAYYDSSTQDNDISIIVLSSSIDFGSSEIRPVCLPDSDDSAYDRVTATVSGWGILVYGVTNQPDVLMEVDIPTMTNTKCLKAYPGAITDNMLCAGYDEGGKASCQGDSGGPLIYNTGTGYTQIGVVSWGTGCAAAGFPDVYTRVTKYLDWIHYRTASGIIIRTITDS